MRRLTLVFVVLALVTTACYGSDEPPREAGSALGKGTVLIDTPGDSVLMYVVVAETESQRSTAWRTRTAVPRDEGTVFLFFEARDDVSWLQNSAIARSVALFDSDGEIVRIVDVEACPTGDADCAPPDPGVEYRGALVVETGELARLGVFEGDDVEVIPGSE
ncbi:MAG TPA: DUF192 domain-containing protein [Actinomycetota bacterium]|jgi:hypothetical protein